MQPDLRRRALILGMIVIVLLLLIAYLQLMLIGDHFELTPYDLTATWIAEQNATAEGFIRQTQAAMTQTPVQ
ncbi:MAG: hypothetical protein ABI690_14135 [Chloroflexota bacterium]